MTKQLSKRNAQYQKQLVDFFNSNPNYGSPEDIQPAGCLALAKQGRLLWNYWRKRYPVQTQAGGGGSDSKKPYTNAADFQGVDFTAPENHVPSFEGFKFGDGANFESARFPPEFNFRRTRFGFACFDHITAVDGVNFFDAIFKGGVSFKNARFYGSVRMQSVWFHHASFEGAHWYKPINGSGYALFRDSIFHSIANFKANTWFVEANFLNAQFLEQAHFDSSIFHARANFSGVQTARSTFYRDVLFVEGFDIGSQRIKKIIYTQSQKYRDDTPLSPSVRWQTSVARNALRYKANIELLDLSSEKLHSVDFSHATFHKTANFRNRKITHSASWEEVTFHQAPEFFGCELPEDSSFYNTKFPEPSGKDKVERTYRTLKNIFAKLNAPRQEQHFFRLELLEEMEKYKTLTQHHSLFHKIKISEWRKFFGLKFYQSTADFGFSVTRPINWIACFFILFVVVSAVFKFIKSGGSTEQLHSHRVSEFFRYHFSLVSPFGFFDKDIAKLRESLFGNGWWLLIITALELLVRMVHTAGYFLIGLALRNFFKIK